MVGRIEVITGGMFCGKTEEMIRRLRRAKYGRKPVAAYKPAKDSRYHLTDVVSHAGAAFEAVPVQSSAELLKQASMLGPGAVIGIDEAQFFDLDLVDVVRALATAGQRVIIAGLDLDFAGKPFGPMPLLMAEAEEVFKVHAVCLVCGGDATRSQRITASTETVLVGGAKDYEARCRAHWSPRPLPPSQWDQVLLSDAANALSVFQEEA